MIWPFIILTAAAVAALAVYIPARVFGLAVAALIRFLQDESSGRR